MFYYYHLLRFHIASNLHIRNRSKFDKSWQDLIEKRRRLRVVSGQKSMIQKMKDYFIKDKIIKD